MQQAYRVLRIVSEAQTIRIVLVLAPDELMLKELCTACAALNTESSSGIKAVVLDFETKADTSGTENAAFSPDTLDQACAAVLAVEAPVLAGFGGGTLGAGRGPGHSTPVPPPSAAGGLRCEDNRKQNTPSSGGEDPVPPG